MRRSIVIAFIVSLALACTHVRAPRQTPQEVEAAFLRAFNALDADAVGRLLRGDATAYLPFYAEPAKLVGRGAIVAALRPMFDAERARQGANASLHLEARDVDVQSFDGGAVVTFDVGTAAVRARRTLVLAREGDGWRIVHLHASNVRPPS